MDQEIENDLKLGTNRPISFALSKSLVIYDSKEDSGLIQVENFLINLDQQINNQSPEIYLC